MSNQKTLRKISMSEIKKHTAPDDCWVVLNGKVYDLSTFHSEHPGGSRLITNNAGKDATALFAPDTTVNIYLKLLPPIWVMITQGSHNLR